MPVGAVIALLVLAAVAVASWVARRIQTRSIAAVDAGIGERVRLHRSEPPDAAALAALPPPVRRYLDHVLPPNRRGLTLARYEQVGTLRTDPRRDRWMAFTATQVMAPTTVEFQWVARVSVAPLVHVQVRDSYVGGRGAGQVALFSAIPVASAGGTVEMNAGSLHRFLAEAVWYPSALLPSPSLSWAPMDDARALATLTDGTATVSLEFRFDANNEVTGIYTDARWGAFDGGFRQFAWEGTFRHYTRRHGVLVPGEGEVGWYIDGQWQPVWRGTVRSASLAF